MDLPDQRDIDARILAFYGEQFDEDARLTTRSGQGPLEFQRTQEIIRNHVPTGRVLDVGGGTGLHARALMDAGYQVELLDPVPRHIEIAARSGVAARVGDARTLPFDDATFDAVLLLGPLYHLASSQDRLRALGEAKRVTRSGGIIIAAALSRLVAFAAVSVGQPVPTPFPQSWVRLLATGIPPPGLRFPAGHFHTSEELHAEIESAGLSVREVVGVEGPAGLLLEEVGKASDEVGEAAHLIARTASDVPGIRDFSAHLIAVASA